MKSQRFTPSSSVIAFYSFLEGQSRKVDVAAGEDYAEFEGASVGA